ncbi:MAG: hypothetical protein JWM80_3491 [Cyanobacteria bacterium RYN_339]|nr:hypothetical protein [Cyanobacteria bacterium RYN_339]
MPMPMEFEVDLESWLSSVQRTARVDVDGSACVISVHYGGAPADLWAAMTNRDHLARWFGVVSGEPPALEVDIGLPSPVPVFVLACEAPSRLVVNWQSPILPRRTMDEIVVTLVGEAQGTRLTVEHRSSEPEVWLGAGSGWDHWLCMFAYELAGAPPPDEEALGIRLMPVWLGVRPTGS